MALYLGHLKGFVNKSDKDLVNILLAAILEYNYKEQAKAQLHQLWENGVSLWKGM